MRLPQNPLDLHLAWEWLVEHDQVEQAVDKMLLAIFRYAEARAKPFELERLVEMAIQALAPSIENPNPILS